MFCFLYFSQMKHKKTKISTDFGTGMVSKFSNVLMKWNRRCYFCGHWQQSCNKIAALQTQFHNCQGSDRNPKWNYVQTSIGKGAGDGFYVRFCLCPCSLLKGTVSRDFLLLVFFLNKFPPSL